MKYFTVLLLATFLQLSLMAQDTDKERIEVLEKQVSELLKWKAEIQKPNISPTKKIAAPTSDGYGIVSIDITNKTYSDAAMNKAVYWDMTSTLIGRDKPTRAIKGVIQFYDLFDELKMSIGWTITKPMQPNTALLEEGLGMKYNQFMEHHKYMRVTSLNDLKFKFKVTSIIYEDKTSEKFN